MPCLYGSSPLACPRPFQSQLGSIGQCPQIRATGGRGICAIIRYLGPTVGASTPLLSSQFLSNSTTGLIVLSSAIIGEYQLLKLPISDFLSLSIPPIRALPTSSSVVHPGYVNYSIFRTVSVVLGCNISVVFSIFHYPSHLSSSLSRLSQTLLIGHTRMARYPSFHYCSQP